MPLGFTGDNPDMCLHIWLAGQRTKCWYTLWVIPCTHGRSFSAHWVDRALTRVHWRCVTWCRACSDVKPLKPQSNDDKQMEHVERTAKICSSLNRISCCLFLEKWNHIKLEIFFSSEQTPNSWEGCFGHTFYSHTLSQMSLFFFTAENWMGIFMFSPAQCEEPSDGARDAHR